MKYSSTVSSFRESTDFKLLSFKVSNLSHVLGNLKLRQPKSVYTSQIFGLYIYNSALVLQRDIFV